MSVRVVFREGQKVVVFPGASFDLVGECIVVCDGGGEPSAAIPTIGVQYALLVDDLS